MQFGFFLSSNFFLLPSSGINITLFNISLFYLFECRRYIKLLKLCHTESSRRYAIEYFRSHKKVELKCAARIFNFVINVVFLTKFKKNQLQCIWQWPECFILLSIIRLVSERHQLSIPSDTLLTFNKNIISQKWKLFKGTYCVYYVCM